MYAAAPPALYCSMYCNDCNENCYVFAPHRFKDACVFVTPAPIPRSTGVRSRAELECSAFRAVGN